MPTLRRGLSAFALGLCLPGLVLAQDADPDRIALARLRARVAQLEGEVEAMRRLLREQGMLLAELQERLSIAGETRRPAPPEPTPAAPVAPAPAGALDEADARLRAGDYPAARQAAQAACGHDPTSAAAWATLAAARFLGGLDRGGARSDLEAALRLAPTLPRALALRSYLRLERARWGTDPCPPGELAGALREAERALEGDPGEVLALLALAEAHALEGRPDSARALAERAIQLVPTCGEAQLIRGCLALTAGDLDGALVASERAWELRGQDPRAQVLAGQVFRLQRESALAQMRLEQACQLDPRLPLAHLELGILRLQIRPRDLPAAVAALSRALELRPDLADAYFYRAAAYHDLDRFESALGDLDRAERIGRGGSFAPADLALIRGHCQYEREAWDAAAEAYSRYLQQAPRGTPVAAKVEGRLAECRQRLAPPPVPDPGEFQLLPVTVSVGAEGQGSAYIKVFLRDPASGEFLTKAFHVEVGAPIGQEARVEGRRLDFRTGAVLLEVARRRRRHPTLGHEEELQVIRYRRADGTVEEANDKDLPPALQGE